ncbi:MAG: DUF3656 domain-containing protein [Clostridiales bacterium]|nr:DUF3656 domain-containing protein [Clostridiales bacterium]
MFSRSGFTDGYFTSRIGTDMLGVRTEEQKRKSAENRDIKIDERKLPIEITGDFSHAPATVGAKMRRGDAEYAYSVSATDEYPDMRELDESRIADALSKCGGTAFKAEKINVISGAGGAMPVSAVNDMRRKVLSGLENEIVKPVSVRKTDDMPVLCDINEKPKKTAFFRYADSLSGASLDYFDNVFLPIEEYEKIADKSEKIGVALPPVCFDGECDALIEKLGKLAELKCVLVSSLWQAEALSGKYELFGDLRHNVFNRYSASVFRDFGIKTLVCSCEAGISSAAGLGSGISAVAYGRLPLMTTQKCAIKEIIGITARDCRYCDTHKFTSLTDRTGASFIVCREAPHRNVIYNSVPVWMLDKLDEYERNYLGAHFIFTDEGAVEVDKIIDMAKKKSACKGKFKRI